MTRTQLELLDVLKAMLARLHAAEEKMDETSKRQLEIEARVAGVEPKQDADPGVKPDFVDALRHRIDELEREVADARAQAARGGEQLKELLGDLVFDDKALPGENGVPQYVRIPDPEVVTATEGSVALKIADPEPISAPAVTALLTQAASPPKKRTSLTRLGAIAAIVVAALLAGVAIGHTSAGKRSPFVVPESCTQAQTLAAGTAGLQQNVTNQYQRIAARALNGAPVTTEQLLPGDKAMADLSENTATITITIAQ
ncbi:MAG: hypothetical protein ABR552_09965, partial [Actinomycetota bacterium]